MRISVRTLPVAALASVGLVALGAAGAQLAPGVKPARDVADVSYGPHPRQTFDLWLVRPVEGEPRRPTPLLVFFHGGGFMVGAKSGVPGELLRSCLDAGVSVASVNYRLSHEAAYPAPMRDGARAVQFLRAHADRWGLDPARFAAAGDSAGAGIALWLAYHDDLAEPGSPDPVARASTRLAAVGGIGAQSSYDPRFIQAEVGGRAHEHVALRPFFGLGPGEDDSPLAHALYESASPINYATADDPPTVLYYQEPRGPLPSGARPGLGIHHPNFGRALSRTLTSLGVPCVLLHRDDYRGEPDAQASGLRALAGHLARHLRAASPGLASRHL